MADIEDELKQVIIIRSDLKLGMGKSVSQGAHASLMSFFETEKVDKKIAQEWIRSGEKKIVLKVDSEDSLRKIHEAFRYKKIPSALVTDAGLTQIPPGTVTALGIGPWHSRELNPITSMLKLL